jgi:hypothetical protein
MYIRLYSIYREVKRKFFEIYSIKYVVKYVDKW